MDSREDLASIRRKLSLVGSGAVVREIKKEFVAESLRLIQDGFNGEHAPDGSAWAQRKDGTHKILVKTGDMKRGWSGKVTPTGIELANSQSYATYQQNGTGEITARPMVPFNLRFLPTPWKSAFQSAEDRVKARYGL